MQKTEQQISKKEAKKRCKKGGKNVVVTYRTSSGLKRGTLELRGRKTFRAGFVSRQTQTMPDDEYEADAATDDDDDDKKTFFIKMTSPLIYVEWNKYKRW